MPRRRDRFCCRSPMRRGRRSGHGAGHLPHRHSQRPVPRDRPLFVRGPRGGLGRPPSPGNAGLPGPGHGTGGSVSRRRLFQRVGDRVSMAPTVAARRARRPTLQPRSIGLRRPQSAPASVRQPDPACRRASRLSRIAGNRAATPPANARAGRTGHITPDARMTRKSGPETSMHKLYPRKIVTLPAKSQTSPATTATARRGPAGAGPGSPRGPPLRSSQGVLLVCRCRSCRGASSNCKEAWSDQQATKQRRGSTKSRCPAGWASSFGRACRHPKHAAARSARTVRAQGARERVNAGPADDRACSQMHPPALREIAHTVHRAVTLREDGRLGLYDRVVGSGSSRACRPRRIRASRNGLRIGASGRDRASSVLEVRRSGSDVMVVEEARSTGSIRGPQRPGLVEAPISLPMLSRH